MLDAQLYNRNVADKIALRVAICDIFHLLFVVA